MTCHYDIIFFGKTCYRKTQSIRLSDHSCLQAGLNHTVPIGRINITSTKVNINHWKIPVTPTYDYSYCTMTVRKYYNFHVQFYKAQLVGAANVIERLIF